MEAPRGINQGRMWMESYNEPIVTWWCTGDARRRYRGRQRRRRRGAPGKVAEQVAEISRWIFEDDEVKRGKIYDSIGRPRDWTVLGHTEPPPPSDKPIRH